MTIKPVNDTVVGLVNLSLFQQAAAGVKIHAVARQP